MAAGDRDPVIYDPFIFRKHFKNIGRAYRERATTLIEICRLYVEGSPQTYTKDDSLQNVFRLADAALSAAGAKKGKTTEATNAFLRVQEEINRLQVGTPPPLPPPRKDVPGRPRKKVFDPKTALESASKKDEESKSTFEKIKSAFKAPLPKGHAKKVNFVILESPHERRKDQLIFHQEIDNSTTTAEIIWRFSRYPGAGRIAPRQNPQFYLRLSDKAASYDSKFHQDPLKDFAYGLDPGDTIYVLVDKSCRLFLDAARPRIFGNLWKPDHTVILKDVGGILDSENIVLRNIGKGQDYWHRPSITDSSHRVQSSYTDGDNEIVNNPVESGPALVDAALRSQRVDLMIRDRSRPEPPSPADSGWMLLPSPEPSIRVQAPEDQTTPRQSAMPLHQIGYDPSIGGSTLFTTSTESFQTAVNTSDTSLHMRAAGKRPQPVDSGVGLRVEPPDADALLNPPSSAPPASKPASLTIPPLPKQGRGSPQSAPPGPDRKGRRKNWFQSYVYDYEAESSS